MSPHNKRPSAGKDKTHISTALEPPPKCPRCDSSNTKFCYYNNYSLTQPRHFCKTCSRYWTRGRALRNVLIKGGCLKIKKIKPSPCDLSDLKFFQPEIDFQLNFPKVFPNSASFVNKFSSIDNLSNNCTAVSSNLCFNLDPSAGTSCSPMMGFKFQALNFHSSSLTSSIESLSSINQELHWKLQRQRLATLFASDNQRDNNYVQNQKTQPSILFQNLEVSRLSTEWLLDNPYATANMNPASGCIWMRITKTRMEFRIYTE